MRERAEVRARDAGEDQLTMNIFTFANESPVTSRDLFYNAQITGRRWALFIRWCDVGFERQTRWQDGRWAQSGGYCFVGIETRLRLWLQFGHKMVEHNGEDHVFCVGPFYLTWGR